TRADERMIDDPAVREERDRAARARSGLDAAEARLKRAQRELARTRMEARFPGRVASVKIVPGQWVRVGDELLTVVDADPIRIEVQVLEGDVRFLAVGRRAEVELTAFPGERVVGRI